MVILYVCRSGTGRTLEIQIIYITSAIWYYWVDRMVPHQQAWWISTILWPVSTDELQIQIIQQEYIPPIHNMVQGASSKNPNVLRKHPRMRLACERVGGQMWSRQRPMRELEAGWGNSHQRPSWMRESNRWSSSVPTGQSMVLRYSDLHNLNVFVLYSHCNYVTASQNKLLGLKFMSESRAS